MQNKRRKFLQLTGLTGLGVAGNGLLKAFATAKDVSEQFSPSFLNTNVMPAEKNKAFDETQLSMIGIYGSWAAGLTQNKLPSFSFRKKEWTNINEWRKTARTRLRDRLAIPAIEGMPAVNVKKQYEYDGLHIEEISWQLPYGRPTDAIILKPLN